MLKRNATIIALIVMLATAGALSPAQATSSIDYSSHYTPHQQTASERLNTFKLPPPAATSPTIVDRAANLYISAPVRPALMNGTPVIQYNRKFP